MVMRRTTATAGRKGHRLFTGLAVAGVVVALVAGCSPVQHSDGAAQPAAEQPDATTNANAGAADLIPVTESGVEYDSDFVAVTAPAGVAPVGTALSVAQSGAEIPGEWAAFATSVAPAVEITLGEGEQPQEPITIDFKGVDRTDSTFVITESGGQVELLPRLPTATLTARTEHLSRFWPVTVDVTKYASYAVEYVANALQITAPAPACYQPDGLYPDAGARISRVEGDAAWPCVRRTGASSVEFSLQSNSAPAWIVSTKPKWDVQYPTTLELTNAIASAAWLNTAPNGADDALLLSESAVNFTADHVEDTLVRMEVDPVMSQVRTAALAVDIFLPDEAAESLTKGDCVKDLVQAGTLTDEASGAGMGAVVGCIGAGVGGVVGAILGILVDGASALWAQLEGLVRTVMRTDDITFEIAQIPADSAEGAPIPEAVAKSMVGTWTGPVDQPGARNYSVLLSLRQQGDTLVGSVEYPELECSGYLHLAHMVDDKLRIQETISKNGSCVEEVGLELYIRDGKLDYYFGPRTDQRSTGTALLARED